MSVSTQKVVDALASAGCEPRKNGRGWKARCPAHDDHRPSLDVDEGADGRALVICRSAGCSTQAIVTAIGISAADLFAPTANGHARNGATKQRKVHETFEAARDAAAWSVEQSQGAGYRLTASYQYPGDFRVLRFEGPGGKQFRQVHRNAQGWVCAGPKGPLPLYRQDEIEAAELGALIYFAEGEQCADSLHERGLIATTTPMGAKSAKRAELTPLHGRSVCLLADNDDEGRAYMEEIAQTLHGKAASLILVALSDLPEKGDVVDFFAAGGTVDDLIDAVARAEERPPPPVETKSAVDAETNSAPIVEQSERTFRATDSGNAERFAADHAGKVLFNHSRGAWMVWNGKRWSADESGAVNRMADSTIRAMYRAAAQIADSDKRAALVKHAVSCEAAWRIRDMLMLARSRRQLAVSETDFDRDGWAFNVENGTVDLRTGELRAHNPLDRITKLAPVHYDRDAQCPRFERFLQETFCGDDALISFVQRWHGHSLTADISEQIMPIYHGVGANGKSVLLDTLAGIMGNYAAEAPPELLTVHKIGREHPTEIADLCGRRLVVASETEDGARLKLQLMKRLTGNITLKARFMRQNYFFFERTHKLILVTNNKPAIGEDSEAVWRRLRLVPFNFVVPSDRRDPRLIDKLRSEWPGILNWLVRGCIDWNRQGLGEPEAVKDATGGYRADSDCVGRFIAECLDLAVAEAWTRSTVILEALDQWNREADADVKSPALWERLTRHECKAHRTNRGRGRLGVRLLDAEQGVTP